MNPRHLTTIARDERGGAGIHMIWVCFVIIFLIPFLWDVGSVHYARRFAGTGADAASLAAAQEYARALQHVPEWNGIWHGSCELGEFTPQQVVMRYRTLPAFAAPPGLGTGFAATYAAQNGDELTNYESWVEFAKHQVYGVPIPWIVVFTETLRPIHTAYGPIYGREFEVPNKALAVAYLSHWTSTPHPCYGWIPEIRQIPLAEREERAEACAGSARGRQITPEERARIERCQERELARRTETILVWGIIGYTYDFTFEWKITLDRVRE